MQSHVCVTPQMSDLLKPAVDGRLTLSDFLSPDRIKLTGVLFSAMFNLAKFQAFEARDPILVKQELNLISSHCQWDRCVLRACVMLRPCSSSNSVAAAATHTLALRTL